MPFHTSFGGRVKSGTVAHPTDDCKWFLEHDEAVAVHGLEAACARCDLLRCGSGDPSGEDDAVGTHELDCVARLEATLARDDTDGQQAPTGDRDRSSRTLVHAEAALRSLPEAEPELVQQAPARLPRTVSLAARRRGSLQHGLEAPPAMTVGMQRPRPSAPRAPCCPSSATKA